MTWWLTPMLFRVTRYRFYNLPMDSPGFYVYIRTKDGTVWSPTFRPCETKVDNREAYHAPGYSVFTAEKDGLTATLKLFMSMDTGLVLQTLNQTVSVLLSESVLTETMKVRFEMFYIQGMKVVEIAKAQGVDEKAVRKSLKLIKEKLINVFNELWDKNNS